MPTLQRLAAASHNSFVTYLRGAVKSLIYVRFYLSAARRGFLTAVITAASILTIVFMIDRLTVCVYEFVLVDESMQVVFSVLDMFTIFLYAHICMVLGYTRLFCVSGTLVVLDSA